MSGGVLLGPDGRPISSAIVNKKAPPPKTGHAFGAWAGRDIEYARLPGGGVVQFDLSRLTLEDYRGMRDHYQVNASLAVLSFMQHQSDFHIECEDERIRVFAEEQIRNVWTGLNRAMSQSNWAGFSPSVIDWENSGRRIVLDKIRDLVPEECAVNWGEVEGWAPPGRVRPKFKIFDGIKQLGSPYPIPVENSFWYPILMENGDYSGKKLLRPAFQSYYFNMLIHLFSNRYHERFGEPLIVARAPFDEDVNLPEGASIPGSDFMSRAIMMIRSGAATVLPNDKTMGSDTNPDWDYQLQYLESQMRGADFERYLTRLDEEISLALFTPILLMRTADVGSYNLGQGHMQMYLWMLNAMNEDRKVFIDKYILSRLTDFNFGASAARPRIVFRKLGAQSETMIKELLTALTQQNKVKFDYKELGQLAGMTLEEITETVSGSDPAPPAQGDGAGAADTAAGDGAVQNLRGSSGDLGYVVKEITNKVSIQFENIKRVSNPGPISMGFKKRVAAELKAAGIVNADSVTSDIYAKMDAWLDYVSGFSDELDVADFTSMFSSKINSLIEERCRV